jgi:PAS domain S-box-containing protein
MNAKNRESINFSDIENTKLIIDITGCVESSRSIREFISESRAVLQRAGLPVFSLSLKVEEKGNSYLMVNADLGSLSIRGVKGDEISELNVVRKILFSDYVKNGSMIVKSLMSGIASATRGLSLNAELQQYRAFDSATFSEFYFSMSPILRRLNEKGNGGGSAGGEIPGEMVIFPIRSDNRFAGSLDLILPAGKKRLEAGEMRLIALISRIIGSSYRNFINIHRASASESKFRAIFESTPLGIYVVNRDFRVIEANSRFRAWYPDFSEEADSLCCDMIPEKERKALCSDCPVKGTFSTGKSAAREVRVERDGENLVLRQKTSPVFSDSGEISSVMMTMEDITAQAAEDTRVKKHARELESQVELRMGMLRENEKNLRSLVSTVYGMEVEKDGNLVFDRIVRGYCELGARAVALITNSGETMKVARVFPAEIRDRLQGLFRRSIEGAEFSASEPADNPFGVSTRMANPVFFVAEEGLRDFFRTALPESDNRTLGAAVRQLSGMSIIILPLETKEGGVGTIAVCAQLDVLENNFEYYQLLSSSTAIEISRHRGSVMLSESERRFRTMVESSKDMIAFCDGEGNVTSVNPAFSGKTGYHLSKKAPVKIFSFFSKKDAQKLKRIMDDAMAGKTIPESAELELKAREEKGIWTEMSLVVRTGDPCDIQLVFHDSSERKKLRSELNTMSSIHNQIIQTDMIGIVITDLKGTINEWNIGATKILGFTQNDVMGKNIHDLVAPGDSEKLKGFTREAGISGLNSQEIRLRKKNSGFVPVMYVESAMTDEKGDPIIVVAFFFDLSEKLSLEAKSRELIQQLSQAQQVTILTLAKLTEYRDWETGSHLERIMKYTEILARELSKLKEYSGYITDEYIVDLVSSCPLHDIGKVGIPDQILHKPGRLTPEEFEIMKNHTLIGGDTISEAEQKVKNRSYLNLGKEVAYYHHEKWNGKGYPRGLKGENIPLSARIVAIADVYDALTSKRPYKEAFSHEKASEIIRKSARTHFDPTVVNAFISCEEEFIRHNNICKDSKNTPGIFSQEIDVKGGAIN